MQCDQTANACPIKVPAPGAALVFLSDSAQAGASDSTPASFSTSVITKTRHTATVDPAVLATSNGDNAKSRDKLRKTSEGVISAARKGHIISGSLVLLSALAGVAMLLR